LTGKEYKHLKTIKSSKGVGEPPLFLGASVYFALRDAVVAARKQNGITELLTGFSSPCTAEILRLACGDDLVVKANVKPRVLNAETNEVEKLWSIRP
jgi:xanthine dehydrogenase/oxidase